MDDSDDRIPLTKDLTTVYEKIINSKGVQNSNENPEMVLQKIPNSSVAVFQNMREDNVDKMRTEVCFTFYVRCVNSLVKILSNMQYSKYHFEY